MKKLLSRLCLIIALHSTNVSDSNKYEFKGAVKGEQLKLYTQDKTRILDVDREARFRLKYYDNNYVGYSNNIERLKIDYKDNKSIYYSINSSDPIDNSVMTKSQNEYIIYLNSIKK